MGDFNELGPLDGRQQPQGGGCISVMFIFWLIVAVVWGLVALIGSL